MSLPERLTEKLQRGILSKNIDGRIELYSPVHGLEISVSKEGNITGRDMTVSADVFLDQQTPCMDETLRMYRQAFLKSPPLFSKMNLELTKSCTLRCPHCFIPHRGVPKISNFNLKHVEQLTDLSPREISITGGEIFLAENIEEVIENIVRLSEERVLIRILSNGSWFHDRNRVNKFLDFTEKTDADFQFRFTVYHRDTAVHDSICGSAGHLEALTDAAGIMRDRVIALSVNFPVTSFSFEDRYETLDYLNDLTEGRCTASSIIYPSAHALRAAEKFSLSCEQLSLMLDEPAFRPLASAYCDPSDQCAYHCRFPLVDSAGRLFACNLPESEKINGRTDAEPGYPARDMCAACSASYWCKKCPSAVPAFHKIYCPLARTAADKVMEDYSKALHRGFLPL